MGYFTVAKCLPERRQALLLWKDSSSGRGVVEHIQVLLRVRCLQMDVFHMCIRTMWGAYRYREQSSVYQWGEGRRWCQIGLGDYEIQTIMSEVNKLQGYIIQYRET